jgi:hypothetical protein
LGPQAIPRRDQRRRPRVRLRARRRRSGLVTGAVAGSADALRCRSSPRSQTAGRAGLMSWRSGRRWS